MGEEECTVLIGQIGSTFGIKGEVRVTPYTDFPERFEELEEVCLAGPGGGSRMIGIDGVRYHKGYVIVKFAGIDGIAAAEGLRGAEVRIPESELMPLAENEFYVHDIIGMDVVTTDGEDLGKVTEVLRSPANDVYVTDRAMIPAVKEFVVSIDLEKRKITVRNVEGLVQE